MDKLKDRIKQKGEQKESRPLWRTLLSRSGIGESEGKRALIESLVLFTVGMLFSRAHLIFGAHPLGVALVSVLPTGVWAATVGAIAGALSLGRGGLIYAMSAVITLFIRVIISGGQKRERAVLFSENLLLRMSAATVGGFSSAVYDVLLSGFSGLGILYGCSMILIPPVLTFILSGLFNTGIDVYRVAAGDRNALSLEGKSAEGRYNVVFFDISALLALFLITHSLYEFKLFGISVAYLFVSLITLVSAKRFGALRAMAVGFVSSLGSGILSVSFALMGLGAGILFAYGTAYALIVGGVLMSAWGAYVSGAMGVLSLLPEYAIASVLITPIAKHLPEEQPIEERVSNEKSAREMVGTMALSYQNRYTGSLDLFEASLTSLSALIRLSVKEEGLSLDDYKDVVLSVAEEHCGDCESRVLCDKENVHPAVKGVDKLAEMLLRGETVSATDVNRETEFCAHAEEVARGIAALAAQREREQRRLADTDAAADEYDLISKLVNEARAKDELERSVDPTLTDALDAVMQKHGLSDGVIRAFGTRRRHFILAAEDESGETVSSAELRRDIERAAGVRLSEPELYRNGKMAMLECDSRKSFTVEYATASSAAEGGEVSGDSVSCFESGAGSFYALLSDGMGKGKRAKETSEFVVKFVTRVMDFAPSYESALQLLNHVMRRRWDECSATVDLFEIDLYTGDATFIKSGAAPSFVKRDGSLFRIRSQTAPIGLVRGIDSERIKVEIKSDDLVIILSDGIAQCAEEAPWLLELLAAAPPRKLSEYAERILEEAKKNSRSRDDMSVTVLKVMKI